MNRYEHIGKRFVRLDIRAGISPSLEVILPPEEDAGYYAKDFERALKKAVEDVFGDFPHRLVMDSVLEVELMSDDIIKNKEEESKDFQETLARMGEGLRAGEEAVRKRNEENPDNGKDGFWQVVGIRHDTIVRSTSAPEAVSKAILKGLVGDWESPEAYYLGEEI
jgi:hypothetical protein